MHLDRLINVLERVAMSGRPVALLDVHQATGLPKPTCYRLVQTLQDQGLVDMSSGGAIQPCNVAEV